MDTLAGLLTPTIAGVAGLIAYLQWRTAHMKVVLDLFDRRHAVFEEAIAAITHFVTREGNISPFNAMRLLDTAINKAAFLFGEDAVEALRKERNDLQVAGMLASRVERSGRVGPDIEADARRLMEMDEHLATCRARLTKVFTPYMRIDQRRVRTPREWFNERNEHRKSFGN